ncbi:MAG: hypothetical protein HGGPFJEG_00693 [Ignavibacteria bacterium]|nr:hypothetical protein [Ignavibacteria bacterium]
MAKEWIRGLDGLNLKLKRETLLNYGKNRWGLNKAHSVGSTSELIRTCGPSKYEEWEHFYFTQAKQKKKDGLPITREYIQGLGQTLYIKLSEVVQHELEQITDPILISATMQIISAQLPACQFIRDSLMKKEIS